MFLHPPRGGLDLNLTSETSQLVSAAHRRLAETFSPSPPGRVRTELLKQEARNSSAIENVHDTKSVRLHHGALMKFTRVPYSEDTLLKLHRTIMSSQEHAQPGRYRNVNVSVGQHIAPPWEQIPELMAEFNNFTQEEHPDSIKHAAWAHIQFETIHPFADGNGRTGRAIINRLLGVPIPLSNYILANKRQYYQLLAASEWEPYLNWFAEGIIQECKALNPE